MSHMRITEPGPVIRDAVNRIIIYQIHVSYMHISEPDPPVRGAVTEPGPLVRDAVNRQIICHPGHHPISSYHQTI